MEPVERASSVLKTALREGESVPPVPEALVVKAREELQRVRSKRVWVRRLVPALAASVVAVAAAGVWAARARAQRTELSVASYEGAVVLTPSEGAAVALAPGMGVDPGATVTSHAGGTAQLTLKTGGELELFESSELVVEKHQRLFVRGGGTRLHVKKLEAGEHFVVATEDAEVEVKGTRFSVEVLQVDAACDVATPTRVHVDEGTVWVRHGSDQVVLEAGASWPTCGVTQAAPKVEPAPEPAPPAVVVSPRPAPKEASLAEQNEKYREAIAARRRGDVKAALRLFETFYREHPRSPMAEAAHVERLRLLVKEKDAGVAAAAEEYLRQYPNGFARDEAKAATSR